MVAGAVISETEANDVAVRAFRQGFDAGADLARAQLELRLAEAEHEADHWYFEANNPEEARAARAERMSTTALDVAAARQETAERWAALDAAGRKAS